MAYPIFPKREKIERPPCRDGKPHQWICEEPKNGRTPARCKRCHRKTEFRDETWSYDVTGRFMPLDRQGRLDKLPRWNYGLAEEVA